MIAVVLPALFMGLAGGAHCITMCGGVAGAACGTAGSRGRYAVAFNLGRVLTYGALGALAGLLGSFPLSLLPLDVVRIALRAFAAVLMLGVGLHVAGVTSIITPLERMGAPLWARVAPLARRLLPIRSAPHAALLGAAWGFVPCGLVYGALSLAVSTGSFAGGVLTMLAFGAGTLPVMTLVATALGAGMRRLAGGWPRRVAGAAVALLALQQFVVLAEQTAFASSLTPGAHACCHGKK